jgi:hypothetical protein
MFFEVQEDNHSRVLYVLLGPEISTVDALKLFKAETCRFSDK